jgi:hypothetical protein
VAIRRKSYKEDYETVKRLMDKYEFYERERRRAKSNPLKTSGGGGGGGNYANTYIINDECANWEVETNTWANTYTTTLTTTAYPQAKTTPLDWLNKQVESICAPGRAALR